MIDSLTGAMRKFTPKPVFRALNPFYHYGMALLAAIIYRFPSRKIKVVGITGTKGKSTTTEILNAMLEEAGYRTAVSNTIRFKIGDETEPNMHKMSMPGRFFIQRFLRRAVSAKCDVAVIEITSQAVLNYRHAFISLDAFIFTNLSPEHIDAHGSFEKYADAKAEIARHCLSKSKKRPRVLTVNGDDAEAGRFLACAADVKTTYSIKDAGRYALGAHGGIGFSYEGTRVHSPLSGLFNLYNILGAAACARALGVDKSVVVRAIEKFSGVRGRVEHVDAGQDFQVIVDYAHTPDSLEKLYQVFENQRTICVLGGTGGGRDRWKRGRMGEIADAYCDDIILTDEDPYDEDPKAIVADVAAGIKDKAPDIIMDRRLAIREAVSRAGTGDAVLITGKGTDPYIMGPNGTKTPWDDADIARQELQALAASKAASKKPSRN